MSSLADLLAVAPPWFSLALAEVGTREDPGNTGAAIQRYINLSHCGAQGEPWCAIFTNAMLEAAGVRGTRSPSSQSFRLSPLFKQITGPALGAIAVFWRGSQSSGLGHVGFYRGEVGNSIYVLGGNEADMVQIEPLPRNSASFGLRGYYWPMSVPSPIPQAIIMPAGAPAVQSPEVT
jgi:uncharacterized protein (TIGR02594 family)